MNWVTVIWSTIASSCLTLAAIYFLVWYKYRAASAHLLFAVAAVSTAGWAFCELWMMRSQTVAELTTAIRSAQVPMFFLLVSITWFIWTYLGAGRTWLAWTILVLRALYVLPNLLMGQNPSFREMAPARIQFLGESVTVAGGAPNPFLLVGQFAVFLVFLFVADASITAWRNGERRKALVVGGSVQFFLLAGLATSSLVLWASVPVPMLVSPCFLGLVAVMGYELSRDVIRASQLVEQLQISEARLQSLSGRLLSAQEEERHRIARELHDNLSQRMALLAIELEQVALRSVRSPQTAHAIRQLGARTAEITTEIHAMSHRLHSAKLEALGLAAAVRGHCREVGAQGIEVQFSAAGVPSPVSPDVELCLFRVVQEGLNNVVKHSGAQAAQVTLSGTGDTLYVRIVDLGRGFDQAAAADRDGLGLASMRERLRLIGGELTIRSRAGAGTTIDARVPLTSRDGRSTAADSMCVA